MGLNIQGKVFIVNFPICIALVDIISFKVKTKINSFLKNQNTQLDCHVNFHCHLNLHANSVLNVYRVSWLKKETKTNTRTSI